MRLTNSSPLIESAELQRELQTVAVDAHVVTQRQYARQRVSFPRHAANTRLPLRESPLRLLVTAADDRLLHNWTDDAIREHYRRWLFRAKVAELHPIPEAFRDWWRNRSAAIRGEILAVLTAESLLPPEPTEGELLAPLRAILADIQTNRPHALADIFPLLAAADTPPPASTLETHTLATQYQLPFRTPDSPSEPATLAATNATEAEQLSRRGNHVRAAILYHRRPEDRRTAQQILQQGVLDRLANHFHWTESQQRAWAQGAFALLSHTHADGWPRAAKALYELQKLAENASKPLDTVAVIDWIRSFGRRPLRQSLDRVRDVIVLRSLHKIRKHIAHVPLSSHESHQLYVLLDTECHAAQQRVEAIVKPLLHEAIDQTGLVPTNRGERIAKDKLVAELVDLLCERGFLRFADLRDAIARNQLKLPDLARVRDLVVGDPLLNADLAVAERLPGVYQRGEWYLRFIQRLSALAFGTPIGRALTLYLALPFGGAFLLLEFFQHAIEGLFGAAHAIGLGGKPHIKLVTWPLVLSLGVLIGVLIHVPAARAWVGGALGSVGAAMTTLCVRWPKWVTSRPIVRRFLDHPATRLLGRSLVLPGFAAGLVLLLAVLYDLPTLTTWSLAGSCFVLANVITHSSLGRVILDRILEATVDTGRFVMASVIPGVISWLVWLFRELAARVEGVLYSVDEYLRYREGQSKESLIFKAILGVIWFPIAYVFRFVFYLLIEPQVNPIKHFPVVTVSHKVLLPMAPQLAKQVGLSTGTMVSIISVIPGIFGFLAWELKENWKLYSANRSEKLEPLSIGHHGETVRGLLCPGFHSGTVPKVYRKLRRIFDGPFDARAVDAQHHELHHVEQVVRLLIERELFPRLGEPVKLVAIRIGVERIEIDLERDGERAMVSWQLVDRAIHASCSGDWLAKHSLAVRGLAAYASDRRDPVTWAEWRE